ncbi:sporulation protein YqfC [Paenibacillus aurantius]|uniref:Sporulation protein YqfC n=1 Tax=Paenibacillus aurantius TaxID=2918900 RepID=A0AA96LI70_9BACL|nr:sporulation protein YqfC [Paenibacillus aurantius]WNQ13458.1 sporulation protein YqfC [Paenibacillus aurantius]
MRRLKKTLHELTTTLLDVPKDVVLDLPRMTMVGNMQLYIENHRGVLHFSTEVLKLALSKGELEVRGRELVLRAILPEEVFVEGQIEDIKYING